MIYHHLKMTENLFKRFTKQVLKEVKKGKLTAFQYFMFYNEWKNSLQPGKNSISDQQPWITFPAISYLKKLVSLETRVFEYGGGGSTLFFVARAKEVVTIEHDEKWFEKLQDRILLKDKRSNWVGKLILPETNILGKDLDPSEPGHYYTTDEVYMNCTFKSYAAFIDRYPDNYFDVILIDGRSRPACIWHSIPKLAKGGFLIVDNSNRNYYFLALGEIFKTNLELVYKRLAPSPYVDFFTETGIWRKL